MENKIYLQKLLDKKAEENNTIDLNAYALGLIDSKAPEMLEMIKLLIDRLEENDLKELSAVKRAKQLIKEATEI